MIDEIILGGGCFWCMEAAFKEVSGVKSVTSGYAGGDKENPSYKEVCSGQTGHAEVIRIRYDIRQISLDEILNLFLKLHNPTTENREGPDIGSQYRSIILYSDKSQRETAVAVLEEAKKDYSEEIVTEVKKLAKFYKAEENHQDYFEKNPDNAYCRINAKPKVEKVRNMEL